MDDAFVEMVRTFLKLDVAGGIDADTNLRDRGLDSMSAVDLLFALEDFYEIVMPDELLVEATFLTAGSLWSAVETTRAMDGVGA